MCQQMWYAVRGCRDNDPHPLRTASGSKPEPEELISRDEIGTEHVETDETEETANNASQDMLIEEVEDEDTDVSEIIGGDVEDEKNA